MTTIDNQADFEQFKRAYRKAIKKRSDVFRFKDQDILVSYARYVIQYLESAKYPPND